MKPYRNDFLEKAKSHMQWMESEDGDEAMKQERFTDNINNYILKGKDKGLSTKGISDKWHTFEELYYHRMVLFSIICNQNKDKAWKSKQHHDGTMFGDDSFICGVSTPEGQYTYHYNLKYWDRFVVKELELAPEYDGHQPKDIERLYSLLEGHYMKQRCRTKTGGV